MAAVVAYVYHQNHIPDGPAPPLTTKHCCFALFFVYIFGIIPPNRFFPSIFFKNNLFRLLYRYGYCSDLVGYRLLRTVMHQPVTFPHSDYRTGIRSLSAAGMPTTTLPPLRSLSAQEAAARRSPGSRSSYFSFYDRGGGMIDLAALGTHANDNGVLVVPVPMFSDNYAYLIISLRTKKVAVVDPADPKAVLRVMHTLSKFINSPLLLTDVLTTHKHWDHAGGNATLLEYSNSAESSTLAEAGKNLVSRELLIYGSREDHVHACNRWVENMDEIAVAGGGVSVLAVSAPGHTHGSLVFVAGDAHPYPGQHQRTAMFTGDSLFSCGIGAPFETTSLDDIRRTRACFLDALRVAQHPATHQPVADEDILIYAGHEYTERMVKEVHRIIQKTLVLERTESGKRYENALSTALVEVQELRMSSSGLEKAVSAGKAADTAELHHLPGCTLPSTLAIEKLINPLLTVSDASLSSVPLMGGEVDLKALEKVIYCSTDRHMAGSE